MRIKNMERQRFAREMYVSVKNAQYKLLQILFWY